MPSPIQILTHPRRTRGRRPSMSALGCAAAGIGLQAVLGATPVAAQSDAAPGDTPGAEEAIAAITQGELASFVQNAIESYTGRAVSIGRLDVNLGWDVIEVVADDVSMANADWARTDEPMLVVGSMTAKVDPTALLSGRIVFPAVRIADAKLIYAVNEAGETNLPLPKQGKDDQGSSQPSDLPLVRDLQLDDVGVVYRNRETGGDAVLQLAKASFRAPEGEAMSLSADGRYEDLPLTMKASGGSWEALTEPKGDPFPLDLAASLGPLSAQASGTIAEPLAARGVDVTVRIDGEHVPAVYPVAGLIAAPTPPLALSGKLTSRQGSGEATAWSLSALDLRLDETVVTGELTVVAAGDKPRINGALRAQPFRLDDLTGFFSKEDEGEASGQPADGQVLPDDELPFSALQRLNADLELDLVDVQAAGLALDRLSADLTIDDGTLRLQPMRATRGEAEVTSFLSLYSGADPVQTDVDVRFRRLSLDRIVSDVPLASAPLKGRLGGRAKLGMDGNSLAEMLGSADGSVALAMDDGQLSGLLIELLGLDVAESLGLVITEGDEDAAVAVRCAIGNLAVEDGIVDIRHFVIDTADTLIRADGTVDLGRETLDLEIVPHPKDFSLLSLRVPIGIQGTFAQPDAFPDPVGLGVEDTADKVANAILTPIVGLLPPIDAGLGTDNECRKLLEQARAGSPS